MQDITPMLLAILTNCMQWLI